MQRIVSEMEAHMRECGGAYPAWYAGIASRPQGRLFVDHGVRKTLDSYIVKDCGSDTLARQVEQYFLERGCKGGPGGGDNLTRYVYVYRVAAHTSESN